VKRRPFQSVTSRGYCWGAMLGGVCDSVSVEEFGPVYGKGALRRRLLVGAARRLRDLASVGFFFRFFQCR
jgi:hypothetical protein